MRYWINTISKEHVDRGTAGGFTQADHGKETRLKRLAKGDRIVFYSPRTALRAGEALQQFTAIGEIADDAPYQVEVTPDWRPWRRAVRFFDCESATIKALIDDLSFITNKTQWGFPFRRGLFEVPQQDFEVIARAMNVR
jgi:hypothetical protein